MRSVWCAPLLDLLLGEPGVLELGLQRGARQLHLQAWSGDGEPVLNMSVAPGSSRWASRFPASN